MNATAITDFATNHYLTYPQANGFADGGRSLVLGRLGKTDASVVKMDLATGSQTVICSFPHAEVLEKNLWFDVAEQANLLVTVARHTIWLYDLAKPGAMRSVFSVPEGAVLQNLPTISANGGRVVTAIYPACEFASFGPYMLSRRSVGWLVDVASGRGQALLEHPWHADHFHFCPHDEEWIGYAHEGPTEQVPDRVWAWHRTLAPAGRCVFDQRSEDPTQPLYVGHERWCFHETSALAVAYGTSPAGPRGLYELFVDGRSPRLVSGGDRDWHCNVSRDGRWAVVDTTGPHDLPGRGWENAGGLSDIMLIDMAKGTRTFLTRTRMGPGQAHPHPIFSPDGRRIYFNDADTDGQCSRVCRVANPLAAVSPAE